MTHYTIDYTNVKDEITKHNMALGDIKNYLGEERFDKLTAEFRAQPKQIPLEQFKILLATFVGIEGYPVKAWYNHIWPL